MSHESERPAELPADAPICPTCGVTALPGSALGLAVDFACDNPDCEAAGQRIR